LTNAVTEELIPKNVASLAQDLQTSHAESEAVDG